MKNCNYCEHLNLTEEQQHKAGTDKPHICLKYGKRVFHRSTERGYHEMIYPCRECENESLSDSDGKGLSMGRFNLNQILSDTSKAAAGGGSAKPRPSESRYEKLSVFDLVPSEDNFYSMREIGELKAAIEIAGKVLQNLVVVPLGDGKYKVIAGHRRRLASIELVNDGKPEYEFVPCVIEPTEEAADEQEIRDGLDLIVTNSQREKTAWDKIEEVRYLREVLEKAKTKPRFVELLRRIVEKTFEDGELQTDGTRDFIAKVLHTSTTQIGRYDTIIRHLSPEFTEELKADRINLSTAYELAGLPVENQNAAFKEYHLTGAISIKAAREWKRPAPPAPPAENTATPTQAERPQKEREPVVERDKVPDTQTTPPYSAAVERDTADGTQDTKPTESTQQSAPRRPQATRSSECGICPYCGAKFDAAKVIEYSIRGAAEGKPHTCQHCGQRVKIFCSVSYFCSPAEE